jgi:glycerophosphoryl diester phosphodiesterase
MTERVHAAAGRVIAWTVNDIDRAQTLVALEVDAICTDTPRELLKGLAEAATGVTGSTRRSGLP